MTVLLSTPTEEQRALLEVVHKAFRQANRWPIFQYVEAMLDRQGLDTATVLASFPTVGTARYGAVWWDRSAPLPDSLVGLTVAGLSHCQGGYVEIQLFLDTLAYLIQRRLAFNPSPTTVQHIRVTSEDVKQALEAAGHAVVEGTLESLYELLVHEPPTWAGSKSRSKDGTWTLEVERAVLKYQGIKTIEEYIQRVAEQLASPPIVSPPAVPSPLSLVASLDYLNAVWQLHCGQPLFRFPRATMAAKLAMRCATADEFDSRLSALSEVLKDYKLPVDVKGNGRDPFSRLENYLLRHVTGVAEARVQRAIEVLRSANSIRAGGQHANAAKRAAESFNKLAIAYPPREWGEAWETIQARVIEALDALREEIQATMPSK